MRWVGKKYLFIESEGDLLGFRYREFVRTWGTT